MIRCRSWVTTVVLIAFLGTILLPAPAEAANVSRTMAGAAGVAAGGFAGTALASAVVGAGGLASMPAVASVLVTTGIVAGCAWVGGKVASRLGLALDDTLGPDMTWTIIGASLGGLAALALLPALGPAFGAFGPVLKVMLGGAVGGVLAKFFAPQLESIATPTVLYGAAGGVVGGLAGGIPGALVGVAGGAALGKVMDKGFFADEETSNRDLWKQAQWKARDTTDRFRQWRDDTFDWVNDRREDFSNRIRGDEDYYRNYEDSFTYECWDPADYSEADGDPYYKAGRRYERKSQSRRDAELAELKRDWRDALRDFEDANEDGSAAERQKALYRVRKAEEAYEKALRECH